MVGRAGAGNELGATANRHLCVRAKNVSPTILYCSLSASTSHAFDPIADEFPRLPLVLRSNLATTLNDDLRETFAAMGRSTVYEFSDDVSVEKTINKHFDTADRSKTCFRNVILTQWSLP